MSEEYEIHITSNTIHETKLKEIGERLGWTYSAIDNDPLLGAGVKAYLTNHVYGSTNSALVAMYQVHEALVRENVPILRRKIERIVLDERFE